MRKRRKIGEREKDQMPGDGPIELLEEAVRDPGFDPELVSSCRICGVLHEDELADPKWEMGKHLPSPEEKRLIGASIESEGHLFYAICANCRKRSDAHEAAITNTVNKMIEYTRLQEKIDRWVGDFLADIGRMAYDSFSEKCKENGIDSEIAHHAAKRVARMLDDLALSTIRSLELPQPHIKVEEWNQLRKEKDFLWGEMLVFRDGLVKVFDLDFDALESRESSDRDIVELAEIISIVRKPEGEA